VETVPTPAENPQQNAFFDKQGRYCRKKPCNLEGREIAQKIHDLLSFYRTRCQPAPAISGIFTQITIGPQYLDPVFGKYRYLPEGAICTIKEGSRYGDLRSRNPAGFPGMNRIDY